MHLRTISFAYHHLNFVTAHACKLPDVRNMLKTVEELVYLIGASSQRLECYLSSTEDKQLLKKFSETRWSQHDLCLASLLDKHHELLNTLDLVEQVRDPKARSMAGSLSKALDPFPFLVCTVTCRKLLQ